MCAAALLLCMHGSRVAAEPPLGDSDEAPPPPLEEGFEALPEAEAEHLRLGDSDEAPPPPPPLEGFAAPTNGEGDDADLTSNDSLKLGHDATELALALTSAALRALAAGEQPQVLSAEEDGARPEHPSPPPPPWLGAAAGLASGLLEDGRLAELFARPSVAAALARELRGVRCTSLSSDREAAAETNEEKEVDGPSSSQHTNATSPPPPRRRLDQSDSDPRPWPTGAAAAAVRNNRSGADPRTKDRADADSGPHVSGTLASGSCAVDGDCPAGEYCYEAAGAQACDSCAYVTPGACDDASGDCCSAAFLKQCPANPADCCSGDGDCDSGSPCVAGRCQATPEQQALEKRALLQGFVRDPRGGAAWGALRGWSNDSDPCGFAGERAWEGIYCDITAGRVDGVILQGYPDLRFELLGSALAKLDRLDTFAVTGTALCGTIPSEFGNLTKLQQLVLYSNPSLSGTIPSELGDLTGLNELELNSNPSLSGTIPSELGDLLELQQLGLYSNPSLSGTIPRELGGLSKLHALYMHSSPSLSGTIPSELGDLTGLNELELNSNPSLSGTIPGELANLMELLLLALFSNPSLSGTIPSELGGMTELQQLVLYGNPSLSGTIPRELGGLSELQQLVLHSSPSLSGTIPSELRDLSALYELYMHSNLALSGSVPSLTGCKRLAVLDLHNCSLIGLPTSLPGSITHLYLNHNPIDAHPANLSALMGSVSALHVLDTGFINSKIQLQFTADGGGSGGTRVTNPGQCHIGAPCEFLLAMYDDYDEPVNQGDLIHNMTLRLGGLRSPMHDNRDGTFTAAIPDGWVRAVGSHTFEFAHSGQEFRPMMSGPTTVAVATDCGTDGGVCAGLRMVEFQPRDCPAGNHTRPDDVSGATCVCRDGFVPDGNSSDMSLSCLRDCRRVGESVSRDGSSCQCVDSTTLSKSERLCVPSATGRSRWIVAPRLMATRACRVHPAQPALEGRR